MNNNDVAQLIDLENLYPKYNCPQCGDWFHMPWKFCKCPRTDKPNDVRAFSAINAVREASP